MTVIYQAIVAFISWIIAKWGERIALMTVVVGVFSAITLTFSTAITALFSWTLPALPNLIQSGINMLPVNTSVYIAAYLGAEAAGFVYAYARQVLQLRAGMIE